jgi:hypothetical protein
MGATAISLIVFWEARDECGVGRVASRWEGARFDDAQIGA